MSGSPLACPVAVRTVLEDLEAAGHDAVLYGRCVRELLDRRMPADYAVLTDAGPAAVAARFERAVRIRADVAMLPTPDGPVDVRSLRPGEGLVAALSRCDLTVHAMAWRRCGEALLDPFGGCDDLAARRLRTTRAPESVVAERPVRALDVARLVSELGFEVAPDLEVALSKAAPPLAGRGGRDLRVRLTRILGGDHAEPALALLARSGVLGALFPGAPDDTPRVVGRLPPDGPLRLAACLRGSRVRSLLRRYRAHPELFAEVEQLLTLHPVDAGRRAEREARARRLARRADDACRRLVALRRAEIEVRGEGRPAAERLERFVAAVDRTRRADAAAQRRATLAIDGRDVMAHLGCGPGAVVGRALRFLAGQIAEDPARNTRETLLALLDAWHADPERRGAGDRPAAQATDRR